MKRLAVILLGLLLAPVACTQKTEDKAAQPPGSPAAQAPAAAGQPAAAATGVAAEAKTLFEQRCTMCHGASGKGDGMAAASLNPKPRDYTNAEWQKSVTDDDLRKIIVEGGAAVGKSMLMPPNPDLKDKPEVVNELVKLIRGFGKAS